MGMWPQFSGTSEKAQMKPTWKQKKTVLAHVNKECRGNDSSKQTRGRAPSCHPVS